MTLKERKIRISKIAKLLKKGCTYVEIGEKFGLTKQRIYTIAKTENLVGKRSEDKKKKDTDKHITDLYFHCMVMKRQICFKMEKIKVKKLDFSKEETVKAYLLGSVAIYDNMLEELGKVVSIIKDKERKKLKHKK